jgi:phage protein D
MSEFAINRATLAVVTSAPTGSLGADWIEYGPKEPARPATADERRVYTSVARKYWKIAADQLAEMTAPEKAAVDAAEAAAAAAAAARQADIDEVRVKAQALRDTLLAARTAAQLAKAATPANLAQVNAVIDQLCDAVLDVGAVLARVLEARFRSLN